MARRFWTDGACSTIPFQVDDFRRHMVLNGLDDIGLTLQHEDKDRDVRARARDRVGGGGAVRIACQPPLSFPRPQEAAPRDSDTLPTPVPRA